jgi:hypothetical protein
MKDLIKKILREEVSKRYIKSSSNAESVIIKHMNNVISKTKRIVPPLEENYGLYNEEWCKVKYCRSRYLTDTDEFLVVIYLFWKVKYLLSKILQVRKLFILNVIKSGMIII